MVGDPFTIRIFVPDGDPDGVRVIDRMNWTGLGLVFPRQRWQETKYRQDFSKTGIYILVGFGENDDDLLTIYVGQGDVIRNRIESHFASRFLELGGCLRLHKCRFEQGARYLAGICFG